MKRRFWWWWAAINVAMGLLLPYLYDRQLTNGLADAIRLDPLGPTDADSIGIPLAEYSLKVWLVQLVATLLVVVWRQWRVRRVLHDS